jgi:23S rRNA (uridine2552-2'-O)-methyltransferase
MARRYQRKDRFHQRAKREGYRSRAAYKLLELARRERLLGSGRRVVDLGCWPGGWLQVAAEAVGPRGRVVGLDLAALEPPLEYENAVALVGDVSQPADLQAVLDALGGQAQVLLCDAAPKLTGVRSTDRAREEALLEAVEAAVPVLLAAGGDLLVKLLEAPEAEAIARRLRGRFERARSTKPEASRAGSSERYLVARGYRGPG